MSRCRYCGESIVREYDPTGQRGIAWRETNWQDDRDFQCGLSPDHLHNPNQ